MAIPTTNLALDLQAGIGVTEADAAGRASLWADQSGAGNDVPQTTAAQQPYATVDADGNPVMRFPWAFSTGHPKCYMEFPATLTGLSTQAISVYIVAAPNAAPENQTLISFGSFASGYIKHYTTSTAPLFMMLATRASTVRIPLNKGVVCGIGKNTGSVCRWNNTRQTPAAPGLATGLEGGSLCRYKNGNSEFWSGDIYRVLVYSAAHDQTTEDAIVAELLTTYGIVTSFTKQVICEGDSLTAGQDSTNLQSWPNIVRAAHPEILWYQAATGGSKIGAVGTAGSMADIADEQVDPLYSAGFASNVLAVLAGTNDLSSDGITGAQCFTRLTDYLAARKLVGWSTLVFTLPDRGTVDTELGDFNTLIRGGDASIDKVIDIGKGSATESRLNDATNATYYQADALHLKNAGYGVIAEGADLRFQLFSAAIAANGLTLTAAWTATTTWGAGLAENGTKAFTIVVDGNTVDIAALSNSVAGSGSGPYVATLTATLTEAVRRGAVVTIGTLEAGYLEDGDAVLLSRVVAAGTAVTNNSTVSDGGTRIDRITRVTNRFALR